ncbi:MAG: 6,7-dimethyl-8-ribityllumazine synthase [Pseudomonadota bacterium]
MKTGSAAGMSGADAAAGLPHDGAAPHILIVEARFYEDIADMLVNGATDTLKAAGATYEIVSVPGALEIPQALGLASEAMRFSMSPLLQDEMDEDEALPAEQTFDGAIMLGCVIRGETAHYDVVCDNANHWSMELAMMENLPLGNGLLTVDTADQAIKRAEGGASGKGGDAARACLSLIALRNKFSKQVMAGARDDA